MSMERDRRLAGGREECLKPAVPSPTLLLRLERECALSRVGDVPRDGFPFVALVYSVNGDNDLVSFLPL